MIRERFGHLYARARALIQKHERHIPAAALVAGSIWDLLTLGRPDTLFANVTIISYLLIALVCIFLVNIRAQREEEPLFLVALMQFCFGNLMSGLIILYGQSATLAGSWLFIALFVGLLFGNEFIRARYAKLRAHLVVYHILLSAYAALVVPIIFGALGALIFVASILIALSLTGLFFLGLVFLVPSRARPDWIPTAGSLILVTTLFAILYFVNLIPPVPLALKDIGMYSSVVRAPQSASPFIYELSAHTTYPLWDPRRFFMRPRLYVAGSGSAYCFSAVFAPDNLGTPIHHRYEQYLESSGEWVSREAITFPIRGGRAEGYRGYTIATVSPGAWRCNVETARGALIGRVTFVVEEKEGDVPTIVTYK